MPGGRPKKGLDLLPEKWYEDIIDKYQEGASDVEVKAMIYHWLGSFSNDLWNRWMREEDEFSKTVKMGRLLSEAWWAKQGRQNLKMKDFNYTGWYMNMKNRFGWTDRVDQTTKGEKIENPEPVILKFNKRGKGNSSSET